MRGLLAAVLRVLAVLGKELLETFRRPWAVATIVLGPFVVLVVFGLGYLGQPAIRASLVIPEGSGLPTDIATYRDAAAGSVDIVAIDATDATARDRLREGDIDLIVIAPADGQATLEAGEQAVLRVEYDSIDPYVGFLVGTAADRISSVVNRELIRRAASEAEEAAAAAASPLPPRYDADLVAAPTRAEVRDLAPTAPTITWFYGIAVLALVVQHVAVTLGALSIFRDGRRGLVELFRLSPIRSGELLIGKYLAIGLVSGVVSAALIVLLVGAFRVPVLGDPAAVVLVIGLLTAAGTGLGLLIGLISESERQVVQATLLVLLTSVFFGGLAVNLLLFAWPIQRAAAFLPITQATRIFNDVLLRGEQGDPLRYALLGAIALALFLASVIALRRKLAPIR
jgi:ABC-type multidrug transport system permease subunit